MKIVVCVKQVPDTAEVKIDPTTNNLVREGVPSVLNPYDENAVEAALKLKNQLGGTVTVVSMGPPQAGEVLEYCMEMGADAGILLADNAVRGSDTLATGYALSQLISYAGYDLILCGNEAVDGCTGQVGPIIACNLNIPQFTYVRSIEIEGNKLKVQRDVGSHIEFYESKLPAVVCILKGVNKPRGREKKAKEPQVVSAADLGLEENKIGNDGSPTKVVAIRMSDMRGKSYVTIDDNLFWEDKIKMIINGGVVQNKKVNLWRGTADEVSKRLMELAEFNRFFENFN